MKQSESYHISQDCMLSGTALDDIRYAGRFLRAFLLSAMPLWFFLIGCSSIDLPTVEQSEAAIQRLRADIEHAERPLRIFERRFAGSRDAVSIVHSDVVNRLLAAVASERSDDLIITFPPTRPLLSERKSILGMQYTNYLDIDSGRVSVNLRRAELVSTRRNVLRVFLHIEGGGRIAASGRHTGIPAHASPRIELSLRDTVSMELRAGKNGTILLVPQRRQAMLHATLFVNLAGWEIPWKEDIPLRVDELLTPMELPGLISTAIKPPVPAREYSDRNYEFVDVPFLINDPVLFLEGQRIVYTFDCDFPQVAAPSP